MPKKIFISYKKEPLSKRESRALRDQLMHDGFDVFRDEETMGGGIDWQQTIYDNVRTSDVLIVLLEPETAKSEWVQREVDIARGAGVSILPLRLGHATFTDADIKTVQEKLVITQTNYVSFVSEDYARDNLSDAEQTTITQAYQRLVEDIRRLADETRVRQRQWANRILIRHTQHPADSNPNYRRYIHPNKRGDDVAIVLATGDMTELGQVDVIVNSENDYMQMARFFESHTLSSTLRRAGAYDKRWRFLDDTIQKELDSQVKLHYDVPPIPLGQVLVTSAGHPDSQLVKQGIRYIFHVSTNRVNTAQHPFTIDPIRGDAIRTCVKNCLNKISEVDNTIQTIAFPILGTGANGLTISEVVGYMMRGMLQFIRADDQTNLHTILLCVYSQSDIQDVLRIMTIESEKI